jgi:hypothetical protein
MSVIENLAHQQLESTAAVRMREQIDDVEAVFSSLSIEARNELHVIEDQLSAANAGAKELMHVWLALVDRMAMNGFEFLGKLARVESPAELLRLQSKLAEAQVAAISDCCRRYQRLAAATAVLCAHET